LRSKKTNWTALLFRTRGQTNLAATCINVGMLKSFNVTVSFAVSAMTVWAPA
jgi:hypothetical protein